MVIPKFARRNGITVHLYVLSAAALASITLAAAHSQSASALLPLNKIPVIGQPVADLVNGVKDGIVKPTVQSVTNLLPQPLGNAVQAPVNALTKGVDPIVGPSSQAANQRSSQRQQQTQPATGINPVAPEPSVASQPATNTTDQSVTSPVDTNYTKLSTTIAPLEKHTTPVLGAATKNFASAKDTSTTIAAGSVLLVMTLLFVSLVAMIMRSHMQTLPTGEHILIRKDLAQASAIVTGLIVAGSILLYIILS